MIINHELLIMINLYINIILTIVTILLDYFDRWLYTSTDSLSIVT